MVWLDKDMQWLAESAGNNGRPAKYTDTAIQSILLRTPMKSADWRLILFASL
ncbi:transposase [Chromobacterium sphagni]|uniref:transposase n=1 Tax=Chromobacterium sphagni TaxID=1903179 RepID=UPI003B848528